MRLQQFVALAWIGIALALSGTLIGFSIESLMQSQATARAIFMAGRRTVQEWPLCVNDYKHPVKEINTTDYIM